jgi:CRISPR-associated endoribonuclease Cas6
MRLRFKLKYEGNRFFPVNYNYFLSSAIYNTLGFANPRFAAYLHDKGYALNGKKYKLFSFALRFEEFQIEKNKLKLLSPNVDLIITSVLIDDFLKGMVIGAFRLQEINLVINGEKFHFAIKQIEEIPKPKFKEKTYFKMLTPMVLSTKETNPELNSQYYLRYNDDVNLINRVFSNNLYNKYFLIKGEPYQGEGVKFSWDKDYLRRAISKRKNIIKKTTIYSGKNDINVIGNLAPFYLEGDTDLIEIGYEAGFGENNSMGFGMATVGT